MVKGLRKDRFEAVFSQGRRSNGQLARVSALPGSGNIGFATSKKIGAKPERNRAKRRFREAVRLQPQALDPGLDIVVIITEQGARAPFERIQEEVGRLLGQAKRRWADDSEYS